MATDRKYQTITKYLVTAVCTQPLHIGSASGEKEEVLVHPTDGMPFLQASGLAGALRQYYTKLHGGEQAERLFGCRRLGVDMDAPDAASKIRLGDGVFTGEKLILELRPRVKIDPKTGTCHSAAVRGTDRQAGQKFNTEYIGAGAVFRFSVYLYDGSFRQDLEELLAAVHQGGIQFGGQKSNGCGFMELRSLMRKRFDMTRKEDREKWAEEETLPDREYENILARLGGPAQKARAYEVTVTGATEGELLVRSMAVQDYGPGAPDSVNIQNAAGEYIVPGSSLKGAVRSQMEKIAPYIGNISVIEETFGRIGKAEDTGMSGNIVFYDTVVGNREDNDCARIQNRIHIDKFTGGVMHGGLFNEKNVSGGIRMQIGIHDRNHPDSTCGLLLMALRDMAAGVMSVGSGYSVGKGIIDVDSIVIHDCIHDTEAEITFETGEITDESGIISRCLKAVQGKGAAV